MKDNIIRLYSLCLLPISSSLICLFLSFSSRVLGSRVPLFSPPCFSLVDGRIICVSAVVVPSCPWTRRERSREASKLERERVVRAVLDDQAGRPLNVSILLPFHFSFPRTAFQWSVGDSRLRNSLIATGVTIEDVNPHVRSGETGGNT